MDILTRIQQGGIQSLSVVGLAKNVGKTVVLNSIIRQADAKGLVVGLSSIGLDGEKTDILTRLAKPRIVASPGTLLATATDTLPRASAKMEIVATTGFVTALGEVIVVRVREAGQVEIAGPDSLQEMRQVVDTMRTLGAELVMVDGALDRVGSAAPTITEATILATGANAGDNLNTILARTLHKVAIFTLPQVEQPIEQEALNKALNTGYVAWLDATGAEHVLPYTSAMGYSSTIIEKLVKANPRASALVLPGAITDSMVSEIIQKPRLCAGLKLLAPDPTHFFVSPAVWQRYLRMGGRAEVLRSINLLAVSLNPTAPSGISYDPRIFANSLAKNLTPVPVYDLFMGDEEIEV